MEKWQLADNFFRLRMYRAKPVSEMKRSGIELALPEIKNIY